MIVTIIPWSNKINAAEIKTILKLSNVKFDCEKAVIINAGPEM